MRKCFDLQINFAFWYVWNFWFADWENVSLYREGVEKCTILWGLNNRQQKLNPGQIHYGRLASIFLITKSLMESNPVSLISPCMSSSLWGCRWTLNRSSNGQFAVFKENLVPTPIGWAARKHFVLFSVKKKKISLSFSLALQDLCSVLVAKI